MLFVLCIENANLHSNVKNITKILMFFPYLIITTICFFPLVTFLNFVIMIIILIDERSFSSFFDTLNRSFVEVFDFNIK